MNRRVVYGLLVFIFLLALGARLYFAFQAPTLRYDAYAELRQVEHITNTGLPLYNDELSFGGRTILYPPLFHYVLALFSLFMTSSVAVIILPNLFFGLLVFVVFGICRHMTRNDQAALFSAFLVSFLPITFSSEGLLGGSAVSLSVLLSFTAAWLFITKRDKNLYWFVGLIFILILTHSTAVLFISALGLFLILSMVEQTGLGRIEFEALIFSFFLFLWIEFLFYKKAILLHGLDFFSRNVPNQLLTSYFSGISLFSALLSIGILPLLGGLFVVYKFFFKVRNNKSALFMSLLVVTSLFMWLRLISRTSGFIFLGVSFCIVFSQLSASFLQYIERTKVVRFKSVFVLLAIIVFAFNSIIPSILAASLAVDSAVSTEELEAFHWLDEHTPQDSTILATLGEGHLVTSEAHRKNVLDNSFLFVEDAQQRLDEVNTIYTTPSSIEAIRLLDKYNVNYVVFSEVTKQTYNIDELSFVKQRPDCFYQVYGGKTKVYELACHYQEVRSR